MAEQQFKKKPGGCTKSGVPGVLCHAQEGKGPSAQSTAVEAWDNPSIENWLEVFLKQRQRIRNNPKV